MHPNYKKTIENCKKEVDDLFKQYENDGTNFKQFEAKTHKDGSKIIQKQHIDDTYPKIDVCSAVICCTLKNAFDTMWSVELQPKLSESLLKAQIIDEFEEGKIVTIYHLHKSPIIGVGQRDFFLIRTWEEELNPETGKKTTTIYGCSVNEEPKEQQQSDPSSSSSKSSPRKHHYTSSLTYTKGAVRGWLSFASYKIEELEDGENPKVRLTYLIRSDPKGQIPQWMTSAGHKKMIPSMVRLKEYIEENFKQK